MPCVGDSWGMFRFLNLGPVSSAHRLVAMHLLSLGSATGSSKTSIIFNLVEIMEMEPRTITPQRMLWSTNSPWEGSATWGSHLGDDVPGSLVQASGGKTAPAFWPFLKTHLFYPSNAHLTLRHWVWGCGDVNVHVNLRQMHNLRHVTGLRHRLKHPCTDTTQVITCGRNWESWPRRVDAEQLARVSWKMSYADWLVEQMWVNLANRRKKNNIFSRTCWKSMNVPHETHFWEQAPVELRLDVFITILQNLANIMILWTKHHEKSMNYPGSLTAP